MISKLFTSSKRKHATSRVTKTSLLAEEEGEEEEDDDTKWTRIFETSMGRKKWGKFKRALRTTTMKMNRVFESFEEDMRMIRLPEREPCSSEQVNKDITRDKIVINGIEFKDHTSGTASQGLIRVLRRDLLKIVKREVTVSKYVDEPESLVEWILQACTRTSHGADSYFALHTLLSKIHNTSNAQSEMRAAPPLPRFLITPAKSNASQDSEVFVGTVKRSLFALVCNFNDYTVQIRDEMGRKTKDTFQLRTLIAEVLVGLNKGRRTLSILTDSRAKRHVLRRLCEVAPRRAVQIVKRAQLREAFRMWYWTCRRGSFDMRAVEKMRQDLREHLRIQSKLLQIKKKNVVDLDVERRSIKASNERLREEVELLRIQIEKARSQNKVLNTNLESILSRQHDLKRTISQLKVVTPTRVRRRSSIVTPHTPHRFSPNRHKVRREKKKEVVSCSVYAASQIIPGYQRKISRTEERGRNVVTIQKKPFLIIFENTCPFKAMQKKDWMKCMRVTSIVPRLISIQTAMLIFEQYSVGNAMTFSEFLRAVTRIARVLFSEKRKHANESLKKLLRHILDFGLEDWSRHTRGVLLRYLR